MSNTTILHYVTIIRHYFLDKKRQSFSFFNKLLEKKNSFSNLKNVQTNEKLKIKEKNSSHENSQYLGFFLDQKNFSLK